MKILKKKNVDNEFINIDFESFEKYIQSIADHQEKNGFINFIYMKDYLKFKELVKKFSWRIVYHSFMFHLSTDPKATLMVEHCCDKCNEVTYDKLTKLEFFELFSEDRKKIYRCYKCSWKLEENSNNYIENWLTPDNDWFKDVETDQIITIEDKWTALNDVRKTRDLDEEMIITHAKKMKYKDFLRTLYWKVVSMKKKSDFFFRCQMCNGTKMLSTHHRTYDIIGKEMLNMQDLTVLCSNCHGKHHEK